MKRTVLLTSLIMLLALFAAPALAQDATLSPDATTDQYTAEDATLASENAAIQAVKDVIGEEGEDVEGAEAYAAALNAARETGVDEETAEVVAAEAVAEVSEGPKLREEPEIREPEVREPEVREPEVQKKPKITELPDTGGAPYSVLVGGALVGGGLLMRRVLR